MKKKTSGNCVGHSANRSLRAAVSTAVTFCMIAGLAFSGIAVFADSGEFAPDQADNYSSAGEFAPEQSDNNTESAGVSAQAYGAAASDSLGYDDPNESGEDSGELPGAMELYGVSPNDVIEVSADSATSEDSAADVINDALDRAEEMTRYGDTGAILPEGSEKKVIVHLAPGKYALDYTISVPENVVLVAEEDSILYGGSTPLVMVYGSVCGGVYDSKKEGLTTIKFGFENFKNMNGRLDDMTVRNSNRYGIVAQGSKNSQIYWCNVSNCTWSGISVLKPSDATKAGGTNVKIIRGCNVSNNGTAGINLSFADVGKIIQCTLNNNGDKAVSTNSDSKTGCHIGTIDNCVIKNNKTNGVYMKPNCTLDHFTNNLLVGNQDGLTAAGVTVEKTHGKSIIKDVSNNTFKTTKDAQIEAQGKGASITINSNNKLLSGKSYGILAINSGKVTIKGSKNIIKGNVIGIGSQTKSVVTVAGKNNQITGSKNIGIYARDNGTINVAGKGNKITGNKSCDVYSGAKSKITLKNVKVGKTYTKNKGKIIKK